MTIRAIELSILISLSTWVGLYLLIRQYGGFAEKQAGTIYLCYGAYLLLHALARTSFEPAFGLILMRFAYVPGIVALVSLCQLACLYNPVERHTKRMVMSVIIAASVVMGLLAVCTPLILQQMVYPSQDGWPETEYGPAFGAWLVYISALVGLSLYCFCRTLLAGGVRKSIHPGAEVNIPLRKFAGTAIVVIVSGFFNHIGKTYQDSFSIGPSILFVLSTLYLAYLLVMSFDRAFRDPTDGKGMSLSILIDTLLIFAAVQLSIGIASLVGGKSFALSTIFILYFLGAGVAALLAGTQHKLYAAFRHEIRRVTRQNHPFIVAEATPAPSSLIMAAAPGATPPQAHLSPDLKAPDTPEQAANPSASVVQGTADSAPAERESLTEDNSTDQQLYRELRLALRSLHDPARLGALHSLACGLPGDTAWQRGEALQQQLIQSIQRLEPQGDESYANQWQHYQILWRLYCEGQSRLEIMQALSLSERHYQRHLHDALVVFVAQWQNSGKN